MAEKPQSKGPWTHRLMVRVFTVVLAVLFYWLLDFVIGDIGTWPGPVYTDVEQRLLDPDSVQQAASLQAQIAQTNRQSAAQNTRQRILRDSTRNSQLTMSQLIVIHHRRLEKDVKLSAEEQKAFVEAELLFLSNQKRYQLLNDEISRLNEKLSALEDQQRKVEQDLDRQRILAQQEYQTLRRRHDLKLAVSTLAVLVPLLIGAVLLIVKRRRSVYAVLFYAFGIAVLAKVALVMHEYFPSRYTKYILILATIAVLVWILVTLLRLVASPGKDWLLKQYREAYETFFCPICEYPIRRGPLKYFFWTRRSIKKRVIPSAPMSDVDSPYTCPMCATRLFEECTECHAVRHSLLPACSTCGAEKSPAEAG